VRDRFRHQLGGAQKLGVEPYDAAADPEATDSCWQYTRVC
jgi:hypothetical protein